MKIAFVVFDQMTTLDLTGFSDVITRLSRLKPEMQMSWEFCSTKERVTDDRGMEIVVGSITPDLSEYDLLFIPGGFGTRLLRNDENFVTWLQSARDVKLKVSVCTGALLLGAAGFLQGKRATCNPSAYDLLALYCEEVVKTRIVKDGAVITGSSVATSIDLGFYLLEMLTDVETVDLIQQQISYPYYRPGEYG